MAFENRVFVITGAAGGLGRVVTEQLVQQGAKLALIGSNIEHLEDLIRTCSIPAESAFPLAVNLVEPGAAQTAAKAVLDRFGRVDGVLHLVGGWVGGTSVVDLAPDQVQMMLQHHLWTTLYMAQAFVPQMAAGGWGRVIVISSPAASHPPANGAAYAIGKAAQETLILALAQELKGSGVTANAILVNTIDVKGRRLTEPSPQNAAWATPEEITALILYLLSDEARMVNGARIPMNGGG